MSEQDLRQALNQYGTVVSVRILRDQQKQSRGVGFARMNDKEQCQAVINRFHNQSFPGSYALHQDLDRLSATLLSARFF